MCLAAATASLITTSGCDPQNPPAPSREAKVVLVFLDVTASVQSFDGARRAWRAIAERLKPGDRIVLAPIGDNTYLDYQPALDREIPTISIVKDNEIDYRARLDEARQSLDQAMDGLIARADAQRPKRTDVFGAFQAASQVFAEDPRTRKALVFLSDMQEDAGTENLLRITLANETIAQINDAQRQSGLVPDLYGARVYVAGADAPSLAKFEEMRKFWLAYVKAANGDLEPSRYGSALFGFQE